MLAYYHLEFIHACMHKCMHACIHTYIHSYIHTYIHTYTVLHPDVFGDTIFLKLRIGQFSDTQRLQLRVQKYLMLNTFWEGYLCLLKRLAFFSIHRLYFIQFSHEIYMEEVLQELSWVPILFMWCQNTSGCRTHIHTYIHTYIHYIATSYINV